MFAEPHQNISKIDDKDETNLQTIESVLEWLSDSSVHPRNKVNSFQWFHIPTLLTTHIQPQQDQQVEQHQPPVEHNNEVLSQLLQRIATFLDECFDSHTQIPNKRLLRSSLSQLAQCHTLDPKIKRKTSQCLTSLESIEDGPFAVVRTSQLDVMESNDRTIAGLKEQIAHHTQIKREVEMLRADKKALMTDNNDLRKERTQFLSVVSSLQRENEQLRSKLPRETLNFEDDPESPLFLNWYPNDPFTVDSCSRAFLSLVSMVRNGYKFEGRLPHRASFFLESLNMKLNQSNFLNNFLRTIGQYSTDPAALFVDSVTTLLTSPNLPILREVLLLTSQCLKSCSLSNLLAIVLCKLIPRILSTPCLIDLSLVEDKHNMNDIVSIFRRCVDLSSPGSVQSLSATSDVGPDSVGDVVLHEVLIPIKPSLVQIFHNRRLLSLDDRCENTLDLLSDIFEMSAFHQQTLDFICSSPIPMIFPSLLSKVEDQGTHHFVISLISDDIHKRSMDGAEMVDRERIVLQTLEQEGFGNHLERILFRTKSLEDDHDVRFSPFETMNGLGMNCSRPR
ncbi:hypothetical protein BLNAU_8743 [Blattamonas nauphoetae]|uniref:Uncharacterized protein n=1 Tax=Blattamonas nauphoetae TaxID=2049346 RepID=A0ABQ9XXJ2_9EUKA|nr:hypothetical protein BLNAU_8743 [Blattamonas nauphoetae]